MTTVEYLRSLKAVRERCYKVFELAQQNKLQYFNYNTEKEDELVDFCISLLKRDYGSEFTAIPPHGRWDHLDAGIPRVEPLLKEWSDIDIKERVRRLVDLTVVSVILDAGAGKNWKYTETSSGMVFNRSEGIAVASVHMFKDGYFSTAEDQPLRVDANGLSLLSILRMEEGFQVDDDKNPIVGIQGRTQLMYNLATALRLGKEYFGKPPRPGNMLEFLESKSHKSEDGTTVVPFSALWAVVSLGFEYTWTSRTRLRKASLGDVWPCPALADPTGNQQEGDDLVPFHKLGQWLAYSLMVVFERTLNWRFEGKEELTGLPEYRNGGLLIDCGVLALKPDKLPIDSTSGLPRASPSHPAVIEWRALTVVGLDRVATAIRNKLGLTESQLTLAQVLEGATWKGGREIAKKLRPETGGPPIEIESDATVF
ncbi:hypothetical protein AX15_000252 [Amanita polypyramis BW_CC]|nr:hypothetical protein AX15_000252 [Amanita polypyramis BW_CC]